MDSFFVGKYKPFVWSLNAEFIPFVSKNIPCNTFKPITRRVQGFTLIELMVTIAVAAVLLGLAVPSMRDFIARNRVATQMNDLLADIHFARTEAIKRAATVTGIATVTICNSSSKTACTDTSWNDGWIVQVDGATPEVLRTTQAVASGDTLTAKLFTNLNRITYQSSGRIDLGGEFELCNSKIKEGRRLTISDAGSGSIKTITITTCP